MFKLIVKELMNVDISFQNSFNQNLDACIFMLQNESVRVTSPDNTANCVRVQKEGDCW
jgi:hypothetical protein